MRLPHRKSQSLSTCVFFTVLALIVPAWAKTTAQLVLTPSSLNFRNVQVGQTETQVFFLTNSGSTPATISAIGATNPVFEISGATLPVVVAAGQSISVNVTFAPAASTWVGAHLTVTSSASNSTLKIPIQGSGVPAEPIAAQPAGLSFGQVAVGTSVTRSLVLSSTVSYSETLQSIQASGTGFTITGPAMPLVLASGANITVNVTFSPRAAGAVSGDLFVSGPYFNIPLSATGVTTTTTGQLVVTPSTLNLGSVTVGSSANASGSLSATGGSVTINAAASSNSAFKLTGLTLPATIAAGQTVPFSVAFSPAAAGSETATLSFTSNAQTTTTTESVSGTGTAAVGQLTVSPTSLSFGSVVVGNSSSASGTLSAAGASVTISGDSTNNTGFKVSGLSVPITIPAGQSVPFTVTYSPAATGSTSATLSFTSNAQTSTTTESLSGTGTTQSGKLTVSPTAVSFGNVNLGSSATQACTLSASGAAVTVNSAAIGNSQFALSGASFPMTLSAGQSAEIYIVFSPTATGTDSGTLTLASNASNSTATESLSGVGTATQYSVSLTWKASTSSVAGYNIYRGTSPGSYTKINSTLDANTAYTDSTVAAGVTYYYAATAVNSSGQESSYSAPIEVAVP